MAHVEGWRSCTLEPRMMNLPQGSRLVGILSDHVDDLTSAGDESDPAYLSALETVRVLCDWGSWRQTHSRCVASMCINNEMEASMRIRLSLVVPLKFFLTQLTDDDINTRYFLDISRSITKRGEPGWLAQRPMMALMVPLSLIDEKRTRNERNIDGPELVGETHSHTGQGTNFTTERWRNQCLSLFVMHRRDLSSPCGFLCAATEENLTDGHPAPCSPISWHSKTCRRSLEL